MTSGHFRAVPIDSIIVNREERQRRELKDIPDLADSIRRLGLIHPIVITRDHVLVTGERRLAAHRSLGWTNINAQYQDEVDDYTLHAIELEENTKRKDISPQEQCLAVLKYFRYRRAEEPEFSQRDLADALGYKFGHISELLGGGREVEAGNPRVLEAKELSTIFGIVRRENERRDAEAQEQFRRLANITPQIKDPDPILNLDFNEWVKTYDGPKFNFVHCDFPYGIESNSFNQGGADVHGGYVDTERTYWTLCESLCDNLSRLTTDKCHFMFWFSMWNYHSTLEYFRKHSEIDFDPFPLVWMKSDNKGILPDPQRGPRRIYETAFFGSRGDRMIVSSVSNACWEPTDQSTHMSIKPVPVLRHFFRMFVDSSTLMLDPTCGSGSSLRAAESLGANYVLGLEKDEGFCKDANRKVRQARSTARGRDDEERLEV
jgi:ParB family chromosome partitioning protein